MDHYQRIRNVSEGRVTPYILESKLKKTLEKRGEFNKVQGRVLSFSEEQLKFLLSIPEDKIYEAITQNKMPKKGREDKDER